jgi:hypothetical protein
MFGEWSLQRFRERVGMGRAQQFEWRIVTMTRAELSELLFDVLQRPTLVVIPIVSLERHRVTSVV